MKCVFRSSCAGSVGSTHVVKLMKMFAYFAGILLIVVCFLKRRCVDLSWPPFLPTEVIKHCQERAAGLKDGRDIPLMPSPTWEKCSPWDDASDGTYKQIHAMPIKQVGSTPYRPL